MSIGSVERHYGDDPVIWLKIRMMAKEEMLTKYIEDRGIHHWDDALGV